MRFFTQGRVPGLLGALTALLLALIFSAADPFPLQELRLRGFDMAQRLWPGAANAPLVQVVAIDEESLRRLGQWPWPRSLIADLVHRIATGKPSVLGVDIMFPEPDRFSPPLLGRTLPNLPASVTETLSQFPSSDDQLARAFAQIPTVLGVGPSDEPVNVATRPHRVTLIRQRGGDPREFLTAYASVIRSLPEIAQAAIGEGALSDEPDEDGLIRTVPLLTVAQGQLIPAFAVDVLRVAKKSPSLMVATGASGIESVEIGPLSVPTDDRGRVYPHFAPTAARYISAAGVLDPSFDPSIFHNRIVLLGVTGLGILDQKTTPLGLSQGIEIHAQLIESMLGNSLLRYPPGVTVLQVGLVLLVGLLVIGLVSYEHPVVAGISTLLIVIGLVGGEFALFRVAGWLLDGIYPAIVTLITFGMMLGGHLRAAQAARRRLARELEHQRELSARIEGELAAARVIQMGLLPHHFPAFPERHDIDLYALVEPARGVGGDMFDFLLIDATHLFFIIADVSGKGIPAALFMAMTKEVVRAAVQRHGPALDQVLAEANSKTAAASNEMDMMFVTAFTGILDLVSGELTYASAGHDRPFLLDGRLHPRQLETLGGPPLGVVEDFPFPIEYDRLEKNALLVLYTDGVTEAQDPQGELYSAARLAAALSALQAKTAQTAVDGTFSAVRRFVGSAEQADDITVLAIRRTPD
ncbi:MAG TPA: CHASE2 domain-containing protein [Stellaceae bacterium]|jgi:serine phosphatase RsbU (regulator of sigma subunit)|nr:CHASE2 domain-containing protein [Stellaceae bacterium]